MLLNDLFIFMCDFIIKITLTLAIAEIDNLYWNEIRSPTL